MSLTPDELPKTSWTDRLKGIIYQIRPSTLKAFWQNDRKECIKILLGISLTYLFAPMIAGKIFLSFQSLTSSTPSDPITAWMLGASKFTALTLLIGIAGNAILWVLLEVIGRQEDKDHRNVTLTESGTYGTAGFMQPDEIREIMHTGLLEESHMTGPLFGYMIDGNPGEMVTLPVNGKGDSIFKFNMNTILIGGSGAGKTIAYLINALLQACRRGHSVIVSDPKLEIYSLVSRIMEKNGYDTYIISTKRSFMENSDRFNPLDNICRYTILTRDGERITDASGYTISEYDEIIVNPNRDIDQILAQTVTDIIMQRTEKEHNFFDTGEMQLLKGMILYVVSDAKRIKTRTANLAEIHRILVEDGVEGVKNIVARIGMNHPARAPLKTFADAKETVQQDIMIGLKNRLYLFDIEDVANITRTTDFRFEDAAKKKTIFFVGMDDQEGTFDFLTQIFFTMAFKYIIEYADKQPRRKCPVPVDFIFEEAYSIGEIKDLARKISTVRSRDVSITLAFQSMQQLKQTYENQDNTIISNCNCKIFIRPDDPDTNAFVEWLGGIETVLQSSKRQQERTIGEAFNYHHSYDHSEGEGKRNTINQDEARRMDKDKLLVVMGSENPFYVQKFIYWDHFLYKKDHEEVNLGDRVPFWQQELLELFQKRQEELQKDISSWLYFPAKNIWFYKDGVQIESMIEQPAWDMAKQCWMIRDRIMNRQLNAPIVKDGIYYFSENPNLKLENQPEAIPIFVIKEEVVTTKQTSSTPPKKKGRPPGQPEQNQADPHPQNPQPEEPVNEVSKQEPKPKNEKDKMKQRQIEIFDPIKGLDSYLTQTKKTGKDTEK